MCDWHHPSALSLDRARSWASPKRNDFRHLRHAYIHLFTVAVCRNFEYVTGTTLRAHHPPGEGQGDL
jgi:hypothetical protein